jgi:Protein of unknown function (DUF2914)
MTHSSLTFFTTMTRLLLPFFFLMLGTAMFVTSPSWGQTELLETELAREIVDRMPAGSYSPKVFCEKDQNHDAPLPVVTPPDDHQVVFWSRVTSATPTSLRHIWHKKTQEGWEPMANILLKIQQSSSFRIWSTKDIHPSLHLGEWMIVVSLDDDSKEVLCIARFLVKSSTPTTPSSLKP